MNATERRKQEWLKGTSVDVLERIINTLQAPEDKEPSPEHPLGGLVHIEGIGQIKVAHIRRELEERATAA